MTESVVVDSSLVVKWLILEELSDTAGELLRSWTRDGAQLLAPYILLFEVTNVLHKKVRRGQLTIRAARELVDRLEAMRIGLRQDWPLHRRALELASLLGQGAAYDSHYLALAELYDCDLWTADARFQRSAARITERVQLLHQIA